MPDHVPCELCRVRVCVRVCMCIVCVCAVADPGFSRGGANSQTFLCRKLHENERMWTPYVPGAPLDPPIACVCQNSPPTGGEGEDTPRVFCENISPAFIFMQFSGRNGQIVSWYPSCISKAVPAALPMQWKWSYERHCVIFK